MLPLMATHMTFLGNQRNSRMRPSHAVAVRAGFKNDSFACFKPFCKPARKKGPLKLILLQILNDLDRECFGGKADPIASLTDPATLKAISLRKPAEKAL